MTTNPVSVSTALIRIGWWNASVNQGVFSWRWWDGACGSRIACPGTPGVAP
jgi:hypothetical protein